jgi:hypothetical protein
MLCIPSHTILHREGHTFHERILLKNGMERGFRFAPAGNSVTI